MSYIFDFFCSNDACDFTAPKGSGYYMYAIADDGERVECHHPGEMAEARAVVGEDASEEELRERTGFNYHCVCIDCLEEFEADHERDEVACPDCDSSAVVFVTELVGRPCPACREGVFSSDLEAIS